MVRYSFMVQAYVWGEPSAPTSLASASLAVPMWALAKRLGQQPLLPYSAYVLDNWDRLDRARPIALDNVWMIQNFLAGQDEAWFVLVHVAIEARAGSMLAEIPVLIEAANNGDANAVEAGLARVNTVWDDVDAVFDRMPERCRPVRRLPPRAALRPPAGRDKPAALGPGLVYEGVAETNGQPQAFRGQTGSAVHDRSLDGRAPRRRPCRRSAAHLSGRAPRLSPRRAPDLRRRSARTLETARLHSGVRQSQPARGLQRLHPQPEPASAPATSNTRRAASTSRARNSLRQRHRRRHWRHALHEST